MPANRIGNNSDYSKRSETAEAINLLLDEMYIEDIAEALTLTPRHISRVISDNGWQYRAKHKPMSERTINKSYKTRIIDKERPRFERETFIADCQTMTAKELTDKYDCTENSVYYWAKKYGCKPKRSEQPYKKKEVNMAYVKECLQLGITLAEVAEMVHVSTNTIKTRLREEGLTIEDVRAAQHSDGTGYNCRPSAKTHDCKYWDHNCKCCDYLAKTGTRRPCPAYDCTVYEKGTRYKDKWSKSGF